MRECGIHLIIVCRSLAEHAGCNSTESNSLILSCLQRADESVIASIMRNKFLLSDPENYTPNPFVPVVDSYAPKNQRIFNKEPLDMIDNYDFNDVPLIIGTTTDEGALLLKFMPDNPEEYIKKHWKTKISQLLIGRYIRGCSLITEGK